MASQIAKIKAGETDTLIRPDPRFIGDLLGDPDCSAKLLKINLLMGDISDERFGQIRKLPSLREITFYDVCGAEVFLERIRGMPSVESLGFSGMWVTEGELLHLSSFPNLKSLSFVEMPFTNAELAQLEDLRQLKSLRIGNTTQVTDQGVKNLQAALPNCEIHHE